MYNVTKLENATGFIERATIINELSNGVMFAGLLIVIWIIGIIVGYKSGNFAKGLLASSFGVTIIAGYSWFMGWIGHPVLWFFIIVTLISIFIVVFVKKD